MLHVAIVGFVAAAAASVVVALTFPPFEPLRAL